MIKYASGSLFMQPKKWLRGILVPSVNRPGWSLIQTQADPLLYASMTPDGWFQGNSPNDGPYEQCLQVGSNLVFEPRHSSEDQVVPFVSMP